MVAERYFQRSAPTQERGLGGLENGSIHEVTEVFDTDLANRILVHDRPLFAGPLRADSYADELTG